MSTECLQYLNSDFVVVSKAPFPFKRNRLRCVRCVNENRKKRKCSNSQSWLPLLRPSIPIGWRLRLLRERQQGREDIGSGHGC